jgi:pantetheine-phosphate adenylyltransferase
MKRIAVFPGSFDPITVGHEEIILRAADLFDEVIVAIGENTEKKVMFTLAQREEWIGRVFANQPGISVRTYQGLTVDFCKSQQATYIIRGLRNAIDFEFERNIGLINRELLPGLETIILLSLPGYSHINSSIVREIIRHGGNPDPYIPKILKGLIRL